MDAAPDKPQDGSVGGDSLDGLRSIGSCELFVARLNETREKQLELREILPLILYATDDGFASIQTLRRILRMAGRRDVLSSIVELIAEMYPRAHWTRRRTDGGHRRGFDGIRIKFDLTELRRRLGEYWEARLDAEGMPAELPSVLPQASRLAALAAKSKFRRDSVSPYYGLAREYLWSAKWPKKWHRGVWERHCEGASVREITEELALTRWEVQSCIDLHRGRCGLVQ